MTPTEFNVIRTTLGFTQEQVADKASLSARTVQNFERSAHAEARLAEQLQRALIALWDAKLGDTKGRP